MLTILLELEEYKMNPSPLHKRRVLIELHRLESDINDLTELYNNVKTAMEKVENV